MQDIKSDRAIRTGTTGAVLLVAVIAAIVSFVHIASLALTHGQAALAACLLPLSIDGTVAASSLVMLRAARLGLDTPVLARSMLGLSVAATLAANIAYGARFGATGALLSGWPAVAFVGTVEMGIGLVRRARQAVATSGPEINFGAVEDIGPAPTTPVPAPVEAVAHDGAPVLDVTVLETVADVPTPLVPEPVEAVAGTVPADVPTPPVREPGKTVARRARSRVPKSVAERARERYGETVLSGSPVPSLRTVMADLNLGQPKAREARTYLESLTAVNGNGSVNHA